MLLGSFRHNVWHAINDEDDDVILSGWWQDPTELWEETRIDRIEHLVQLASKDASDKVADSLARNPAAYTWQLSTHLLGKTGENDIERPPALLNAYNVHTGELSQYKKASDNEQADIGLIIEVDDGSMFATITAPTEEGAYLYRNA